MRAAVQELPTQAGIGLATWNWKAVRQFVAERFGVSLGRSSCLNWLHRLGFAFKRPKKRLVKADAAKRESFAAADTGGKIFFADEAHFRADAELRGKWVLRGEPALVDSSSPRRGEKASYYSAVCLETGEVEWMDASAGSAGGEQQRCQLGGLPGPVAPASQRPARRDLGQRAGTPGRGGKGVPADSWAGASAGEPAGIQPRLQCR